MARKPRIEIAGYYHIVNREVERRVVFHNRDDLKELEKVSSLVEASNITKKTDENELMIFLSKAKDIKQRNELILKAYEQGYSQHKIAKVLELNQAIIQRIIKRTRVDSSISIA